MGEEWWWWWCGGGHKTLICGQIARNQAALFPKPSGSDTSVCLYVSRSVFMFPQVLLLYPDQRGNLHTPRGSLGKGLWGDQPWLLEVPGDGEDCLLLHVNGVVAWSQGCGGDVAPPVRIFREQMLVEQSTGVCLECEELGMERMCSLFPFSGGLCPRSPFELAGTRGRSWADSCGSGNKMYPSNSWRHLTLGFWKTRTLNLSFFL